MDEEMRVILEKLPETVKLAVSNYQTHKILQDTIGINDFTFDKIAQHMGNMMAERHNRWKPIADGLIAMQELSSK